jgi:hypothetical protein
MSVIMLRGTSDGALADVEDGALLANPVSDWEKAVADGDAYSWTNATYDPAAHDTILGVQNDSTTRDLYIYKMWVNSDTASQFVVHTSSGVTMAGTAVTGVNLNRGSSNVAPATAEADETGNGQQAASYTGRLVTGYVAADGLVEVALDGAVVLPYGHNIGIDLTEDATGSVMTIWGYFKDRE